MNIKEIQTRKQLLEADICNMLKEFQHETGLNNINIYLEKVVSAAGDKVIMNVNIQCEI